MPFPLISANASQPDDFALLKAHPIPTWIINAENFSILYNNEATLEQLGDDSVHAGRDFLDFFTEVSRISFFQKISAGIIPHKDNYTFSTVRGELVFVELYLSSFQYDGKLCYQVSCINTTHNVIREQKIEEERTRYKTYIDYSADGIYCQEFSIPVKCDIALQDIIEHAKKYSYISECNDSMARMYGFERAGELIGILSEQILDFDAPANLEFFKQCVDNGFRINNAISQEKNRFGEDKFFLNNAIGVIENGYLKRIWGTQQDVTEKKKTEEYLQLLANLVEQTSDILTAADINYNPVTWNKSAERIYGITAEQIIGKNLNDFITIRYIDATREEIREIISTTGEWTGESYFTRPTDGKVITLMSSFKLMKDANGAPLGFLVSSKDISDRKQAESRLVESENRFREMADSSPVMIWMSNEENITTYINNKWLDFTGVDITGNPGGWAHLVHKDDLINAKAEFSRAFNQRKEITLTYRLLHKDGNFRWVHDVSVPRMSDGVFIGYIGSVVDIEDQKQKEHQLHYNAIILENVSDVIISTSLDFKVISLNASAEFYYGITESEVIDKRMDELLRFDFVGTNIETVIFRLQNFGIWKGEVSVITKTGDKKHFLHSIKEIRDDKNNRIGYLAVGKDISEMKQAQEEMRKSEEFYRTLIADSLDGMILVNVEGLITFSSPSVKNVLGYNVDELIGKNSFEFVHPDDLLWAAQSFQKEVIENPEVKFITVRLKKKNSDWQWCSVRGHNMLNKPGIDSIVIYFHDDTLRKQAKDALKESEKRFRDLIRDLQVGVFLTNKNEEILLCNKALAQEVSMPIEEIVGKSVYDILNKNMINERGEHINYEDRPLTSSIRTKKPVKDFVIGVSHPRTNENIWILVNCDPFIDDKGEITHVVASVLNITERKKLEQKLVSETISHQRQLTQATLDGQEAERREIGKELHDNIGQQLTTIKLFLDLAKSTADDTTNEMVSMALKGVGDVINEIRAMSRSLVPSTLQDLGLIESITELIESMSRTQLMEIEFEYLEFDEEVFPENQKLTIFRIIQEQLNNIIKHAGASHVQICLKENNNQVSLTIKDDGKGFDPKKVRKGLGFINIANRAELFGGKKQVITAPGKGCLLKVIFPHPKLNTADTTLPISLT